MKGYWDLFWSTGRPELWLMSRSEDRQEKTVSERSMGGSQELSRPLANFQPRLSENFPSDPRGLI